MKKFYKNILSYILVLTLIFSAIALNINTYAEDNSLSYEGKCGENIYWFFNSKSGLLELKGEGQMFNYEADGSPFYSCKEIKSVTIASGITELCDNVFSYCNELTTVTFSGSISAISTGAFEGCSSLSEIILPDKLTSIEAEAFYDCTGLKALIIPCNVNSIGESAFEGSGLEEITIPSSVSVIEKMAFYGCTELVEVTISGNASSIAEKTFANCSSLERIAIPESVTKIEKSAFYGCDKLKAVFWAGNEEKWKNLSIAVKNEPLQNAEIYYNCIGMHEHQYSTEITVPATCSSDGIITYTCECGKTYTEAISGGHTWTEWEYYSEEQDVRTCTRCNKEEYRDKEYNENNVFSLNIIEETDDYILLGVKLEDGSFCGVDLSVVPLSDNVGACEEIYESEYFLSFCKKIKTENQITASSYSNESFMYSFAATAPFYASEESIVLYKFTKATKEKVSKDDIKLNVRYCFDEEESYIDYTVINNLPESEFHKHSFTCELTKRETCTENGVLTYSCECGDSYEELIPAEHKYIHKKTAPSYSVDGFEYDVCIECYNVINYRAIPCLSKLVGTIGKTEIDFQNKRIYGISPNSNNILEYLEPLNEAVTITADTDIIGTGTEIIVRYEGRTLYSFDAIIFGDVNGDGKYDGIDALIVKLNSYGILAMNETKRIAADCNHDGIIDSLDIEILDEAGLLLSEIAQSTTEDEAFNSSTAYTEYVELIEQSNEAVEDNNIKSDICTWFNKVIEIIKMSIMFFSKHVI